ncbi:MAG: acetyl-CoA carboxylase, carboxyltransferase subunit beta [bacterium]
MGWFTRSSQQKVVVEKKEDVWVKCPSCSAHIFKEEWETSFMVCSKCNHHDRMTCDERLAMLLDAGSFEERYGKVTTSDPLKFADATGTYAAKIEATKQQTGLLEAVKSGRGAVNGTKIVISVMDFRFVGGSLSSGAGEKIFLAACYAHRHTLPFVMVSTSGGARMQEGIISLMQMAKTCAGISRLRKSKMPYISILTDPTFGGVSASYALVGDINIAEPEALIGFAGRRVIEQTIKEELPPDFQTAEYLLKHGFLDMIVKRAEMKETLHKILQYSHPR